MKTLFKYSAVVFLGLGCAILPVAAEDDEQDEQQDQETIYEPGATFQRSDASHHDDETGEYRGGHRGRRGHDGLGQIEREVDHLNGMLAHVQRSMRRYHAGRDVWRHYEHVQAEVRQISRQFRRGEQYYNRRQLRAQIDHMHDEMHGIEQQLDMPSSNYYRWSVSW